MSDLLDQSYSKKNFEKIIDQLLPDNFTDKNIEYDITGYTKFKSATLLKRVEDKDWDYDFGVIEIELKEQTTSRIGITKDIFKLTKNHGLYGALVAIYCVDDPNWRLSFVSFNAKIVDGNLEKNFTNPKRLSYYLGPKAPTKTPKKYLNIGIVAETKADLKKRFDIEVVTKVFFEEIKEQFELLKAVIQLPENQEDHNKKSDIALRLVGRLLFCWFLREKGWVSKDVLTSSMANSNQPTLWGGDSYYHSYLEPLFYEILNTPAEERKAEFDAIFAETPYLNGGLFEPKADDYYDHNQSNLRFRVPNGNLESLLKLLELYHFTVDENTSYDQEIAVDPEMLGKIFENFILNRSDTGSFYTPRPIVDYMVSSSIQEFLKNKYPKEAHKYQQKSEFDRLFELSNDELMKHIHDNPTKQLQFSTNIFKDDIILSGYTEVLLQNRILLKLRGYEQIKHNKGWQKVGSGHPEVSKEVIDKIIKSEFDSKTVIWGRDKKIHIENDSKTSKLPYPVIGCVVDIETTNRHQKFVIFYSPLMNNKLAITTIYPIDQKKLDKLVRKTTKSDSYNNIKKNKTLSGQMDIVTGTRHSQIRSSDNGSSAQISALQQYLDKIITNKDLAVKLKKRNSLLAEVDDIIQGAEVNLEQETKDEIIQGLFALKILDPACGSGAFPMGVLLKLTEIIHVLDPYLKVNTIKRRILENCIYGVDLLPIAVEISRLRAWLTLVVDEVGTPEPLPNLEFKFVTANSLIGLNLKEFESQENATHQVAISVFDEYKPELSKSSIFENKRSTFDEMKAIIIKYFGAENSQKSILKHEYLQKLDALQDLYLTGANASDPELAKLAHYHPFENTSAPFFDPEWMFGVKNFDLVIGNPPYVGEKGNKETFNDLKQTELGKRFYQGKMDLFYFFFHLGLDNLVDGGILSFITTNYFITATGGVKLRKDIEGRSNVLSLINFGELKIFKSALGQHNMITVIQKKTQKNIKSARTIITNHKGYLGEQVLSDIVEGKDTNTSYYTIPQDQLYTGGNIKLTKGGLDDILDKMKINSTKLSKITQINQGLLSGADTLTEKHILKFGNIGEKGDGIFVLDMKNATDKVVYENIPESEKNIFKPFYKNSDISKYNVKTNPTKFVIYITSKTKIEKYPSILKHLEKYKTLLAKRLTSYNEKYEWYCLHRERNQEIFEGEKIIIPYRSSDNLFSYTNKDWYFRTDAYSLTNCNNLKFLLGILNSKLIYKWLYNRGKRKGETLELFSEPLSKIPIPLLDTEDRQDIALQIEQIVEKILAIKSTPSSETTSQIENRDTDHLESQIDKLVYQLYDLDQTEIDLIEKNK